MDREPSGHDLTTARAKGLVAACAAVISITATPTVLAAAVAKGRPHACEALGSAAGAVGGDLLGSSFGGRRGGGSSLGAWGVVGAAGSKARLAAGSAVVGCASTPSGGGAAVAEGAV